MSACHRGANHLVVTKILELAYEFVRSSDGGSLRRSKALRRELLRPELECRGGIGPAGDADPDQVVGRTEHPVLRSNMRAWCVWQAAAHGKNVARRDTLDSPRTPRGTALGLGTNPADCSRDHMERKLRQGPERNDLNGSAPDTSDVVLLLIDVINDLDFEGGDQLARHATPMAKHLSELKRRAQKARVPCIYANDNYGRWRSDFSAQVEHCLHGGGRGAFLAEALHPDVADYFVLKPMHSGFYQTCLELLLNHLGARRLVVGGIATDNCVNFTSNDAYIRGYKLVLLSDGCASIDPKAHRMALSQMERLLHARIARCDEISFSRKGGRVVVR